MRADSFFILYVWLFFGKILIEEATRADLRLKDNELVFS